MNAVERAVRKYVTTLGYRTTFDESVFESVIGVFQKSAMDYFARVSVWDDGIVVWSPTEPSEYLELSDPGSFDRLAKLLSSYAK